MEAASSRWVETVCLGLSKSVVHSRGISPKILVVMKRGSFLCATTMGIFQMEMRIFDENVFAKTYEIMNIHTLSVIML